MLNKQIDNAGILWCRGLSSSRPDENFGMGYLAAIHKVFK